MKDIKLQEYLGMVIHMIYYHRENLNRENIFPENYWKKLKTSSSRPEYFINMYNCLDFALTQEGYYIDRVNYPYKNDYTKEEIMSFFEQLHVLLKENLEKDKHI